MKALILDLPYPSIEDVCEDRESATIISPAYAGLRGELTAVLQYRFHSYYFKFGGDGETAEILDGISLAEMKHFDMLGELILKLGYPPVYVTRIPDYRVYSAESVTYGRDPQNMLVDDINGELRTVAAYEKIISLLKNERVAAVIKRIKLDEELHVKVLREALERYSE